MMGMVYLGSNPTWSKECRYVTWTDGYIEPVLYLCYTISSTLTHTSNLVDVLYSSEIKQRKTDGLAWYLRNPELAPSYISPFKDGLKYMMRANLPSDKNFEQYTWSSSFGEEEVAEIEVHTSCSVVAWVVC